jgi:hypothetical protein
VGAALANLSDVEFEQLVADLLRAQTGRPHRVFRRAADGGVDVRFQDAGVLEVTQCKHYVNSTFPQLLAEAKREKVKIDTLDPAPTQYRFVTSRTLTAKQVGKIAASLAPWITSQQDVWDGNEFDRLLTEHDHVLRQHVKLWLAGGSALGTLLRAATHQRSHALVAAVQEVLPRYVQTERFFDAQKRLGETGTCLIAGEPGIGKTTMAQMLLLDLTNQGFEPLEVSADVDEAWDVLDERHPQTFYYDDFLGRSAAGERLSKNEDHRLVSLMRLAARRPKTVRLILTTREYILREATTLYESFRRAGLDHERFLLRLPDYTRYERALIFYNHIYHSGRLTREQLDSLLRDRAYLQVVDHEHYNPRVIEYITGLGSARELPVAATVDYAAFAVDALDHPHQIWEYAFANELNVHQQTLLLVLVTLPERARMADLRRAFMALAGDVPPLTFGQALKTLELTFIALSQRASVELVTFSNPSVEDFLADVLAREPDEVGRLVCGAVALEQLQALWSLGRVSGDEQQPSPPMAAALGEHQRELAEAVARTWDAAPISLMFHHPRTVQPIAEPVAQALEYRLTFAVRVRGLGAAAQDVLEGWLGERLQEAATAWQSRRGDGHGTIALLRAMRSCGLGDEAARLASSAKAWLSRRTDTPRDFELLWELRRAGPEVFTVAEWQGVLDEFHSLATDMLEDSAESHDELEELEEVATALGVDLDYLDLELAHERVSAPEPDYEPDEDRAVQAPDELPDPDADIDELFSRLGE